jgi:muconate cycloisomerase
MIENHFAPILYGRAVDDIEAAVTAIDRAAFGNPFAKAAVEMALWDLHGQIEGQPLWRLLYPGATAAKPIPVRGSISASSPEEAQKRAQWFLEQGLRAVKVKVGVGGVAVDVARVRAARDIIGDSMPLGIDANGGWSVDEAVAAIRALESVDLQYVEQPVARGDFAGMRAVRDQVGVPLMADETVWTMRDVETLLHLDAADIVSLYPGKMGGLSRCREIAARLVDAGKTTYIGSNLELDLGTSAMAHLAVALPGADFNRWHSDIIGTLYYERTLIKPPFRPIDGAILPPAGPGLGISLEERKAA